jgi:hypothetical protein
MATPIITIPATELAAGDQAPDVTGHLAYTVQGVRRATAAQARQVPGMTRGDIIATIRWLDGGETERWWKTTDQVNLVGRAR